MSGLWAFIKAVPELLALWNELKKLFEFAKKEIDSRKRIKKLRDGIEYANKTKDTRVLEEVFRGKK